MDFRSRWWPRAACVFAAVLVFFPRHAYGQLAVEMATDKAAYAYGESMVVTFKLTNPTTQVVQTDASCPPVVTFDGLEFGYVCLAKSFFYSFNPGSWRIWTITIDPTDAGVPTFTGEHSITVDYGVYSETRTVEAPEYLGGMLFIEFASGTSPDTIESIRAALNGEILGERLWTSGIRAETWRISGVTLDQAIAQYENHPAVVDVAKEVPLLSYTSTDTERSDELPARVEVSGIYPNPAASRAVVKYELARPGEVFLELYDAAGREVLTPVVKYRGAGTYEEAVGLESLSAGWYLVRVRLGDVVASRAFVVVH